MNEAMQLPALIDRACSRLEQARSSAEVLEARAIAQAALHYAKVTQAANETHADCLRMIVRAEMRMADEVDKGQARGDVQTVGGDRKSIIVHDSDNGAATLDDLGLDRRRLAEWRDVRDAGPGVVEQAINGALSEGRAPTKADIRRAVQQPVVKPGAPSNGLMFARLAIRRLEEIQDNDSERQLAFNLVREWLDEREA